MRVQLKIKDTSLCNLFNKNYYRKHDLIIKMIRSIQERTLVKIKYLKIGKKL